MAGGADPAHALVIELFRDLGPVSVRRMFGGAGVYAEGVMFALLADGAIYLKADAAMHSDLVSEGSAQFVWIPPSGPRAGRPVAMSYWRLPERALDDPDAAALWGRRALAVAHAAAAKTTPKSTRARRRKPLTPP